MKVLKIIYKHNTIFQKEKKKNNMDINCLMKIVQKWHVWYIVHRELGAKDSQNQLHPQKQYTKEVRTYFQLVMNWSH